MNSFDFNYLMDIKQEPSKRLQEIIEKMSQVSVT
jgi:hypothetical protein